MSVKCYVEWCIGTYKQRPDTSVVQLTGVLIAAEEVSLAWLPAESPDTDIAVHRTWASCGSCALRYT